MTCACWVYPCSMALLALLTAGTSIGRKRLLTPRVSLRTYTLIEILAKGEIKGAKCEVRASLRDLLGVLTAISRDKSNISRS